MEQDLRRSPTTSTQYPNHCGSPSIQPHTCEHRALQKHRNRCAIPEPCVPNLVQTLLHNHMINPPTNLPTITPIFTTPQSRIPCEYDRCNLYESNKMSRGFIIGRALFCPVYQIFNHAAKHMYHIERALHTRPRLRHSLTQLTYIPEENTAITST